MLLGTEYGEIKVSYKWGSARGRKFCFCNFGELSYSTAGMYVQLASLQRWYVKRKTKLKTAGIASAVVLASG